MGSLPVQLKQVEDNDFCVKAPFHGGSTAIYVKVDIEQK